MKGVILAAGYGTRFLPVTKVVPKELLPIVDRPAIAYVIDELVEAGITEVLVIGSRRKKALEDWFDREVELESVFRKEKATAKLQAITPQPVNVHFVRQSRMGGTGHALLAARTFVGEDPFVVAYPDDVFPDRDCAKRLVEVHERTGGCVLAAVTSDFHDLSRYGVIDYEVRSGELVVREVIEKPPAGRQPSQLISLGRYLYTPAIFPLLEEGLRTHADGEFYPMDALATLGAQGKVFAAEISGRRWDTGERLGYLKAVFEAAMEREDLGPELRAWLQRSLA